MIRGAHQLLMRGVRGRDKSPGRYREEQNWIGVPGCTIEQAAFVPIAPEHLQQGMDDWEAYLGRTDVPDALVQLALVHVEFEALHPFQDGNGRLGRMLIPLFLHQRGLLSSPDFYISGYFETHRDAYLERLRAVSRDDDWTGWCEFFLRAVQQQSGENETRARGILALYDRTKNRVADLTRSQHAIRVVDFIFRMPIFSATTFIDRADIPKPTASRILSVLRDSALLVPIEEARGRRPGIYAFRELVNIAEGGDVL